MAKLHTFLVSRHWQGRGNAIVNLYAHEFLTAEPDVEGPLRSLAQLGIEVAVPQPPNRTRRHVRKDQVIWPASLMTAWPHGQLLAVVMEWKRDAPSACAKDIAWLTEFTRLHPQTLGVSACASISPLHGVRYRVLLAGQVTATTFAR